MSLLSGILNPIEGSDLSRAIDNARHWGTSILGELYLEIKKGDAGAFVRRRIASDRNGRLLSAMSKARPPLTSRSRVACLYWPLSSLACKVTYDFCGELVPIIIKETRTIIPRIHSD